MRKGDRGGGEGAAQGAVKVCYWRCATELIGRYTYCQYRIFS